MAGHVLAHYGGSKIFAANKHGFCECPGGELRSAVSAVNLIPRVVFCFTLVKRRRGASKSFNPVYDQLGLALSVPATKAICTFQLGRPDAIEADKTSSRASTLAKFTARVCRHTFVFAGIKTLRRRGLRKIGAVEFRSWRHTCAVSWKELGH